jgi:hypothetical protein
MQSAPQSRSIAIEAGGRSRSTPGSTRSRCATEPVRGKADRSDSRSLALPLRSRQTRVRRSGVAKSGCGRGGCRPACFGIAAEIEFIRDVRPIVEARCVECRTHGRAKGEVSLETRDSIAISHAASLGPVSPKAQDHSEARDVQSHDLPACERKRLPGRSMHRGTLGRFDLARRHPPIGSCKLRDPRGSTTLLRVRVHATPRWSLRPARRLIPIAVVSLARRRFRARACHRARGTTAIRITRRGAAGPGSAPSRSRRSRPECRASRAAWAPSSALRDRPARRATAESPASRRRRRTRAP